MWVPFCEFRTGNNSTLRQGSIVLLFPATALGTVFVVGGHSRDTVLGGILRTEFSEGGHSWATCRDSLWDELEKGLSGFSEGGHSN